MRERTSNFGEKLADTQSKLSDTRLQLREALAASSVKDDTIEQLKEDLKTKEQVCKELMLDVDTAESDIEVLESLVEELSSELNGARFII
ncbi:MAG: hypothetical protein V2I33_21565 [Kangiellaceae bacterium]|jgi:chromosome segregation ATPase|nr:hypothetical protein [Kangiellaceae bacterium]